LLPLRLTGTGSSSGFFCFLTEWFTSPTSVLCLKHHWSHGYAACVGNSALYIQVGVRNFVLQDSEICCFGVSYDHAFVLAPPARVVAPSFVASIRRTMHLLPVRAVDFHALHIILSRWYHPASYTEVAGSRHGGRSTAWGSCNRPGLPGRLISQQVYCFLRRLNFSTNQGSVNGIGVLRLQCSHQVLLQHGCWKVCSNVSVSEVT